MDYAEAAFHASASGFADAISDYRMIARCIKYGMLLVLFSFAVFFLYEVLHTLRIHPMQYLLLGGALSIFYLLLLSLAEQIGFISAYWLAATACIGLMTWYLSFVVKNPRYVWWLALLLTGAYLVIFILLRLPTYNLLLGSALVFTALFVVMYLTRHTDWYQLGEADCKGKTHEN